MGNSKIGDFPALAIAANTMLLARDFAARLRIAASTKLFAIGKAMKKASSSADGDVSSNTGFRLPKSDGSVRIDSGPATEGSIAPLSSRSIGRTNFVSNVV